MVETILPEVIQVVEINAVNAVTSVTDSPPKWMHQIVRRQQLLNRQYLKARQEFAGVWNDFLSAVQEVNEKYGTEFTAEQSFQEFQGQFSDEGFDAEEVDIEKS